MEAGAARSSEVGRTIGRYVLLDEIASGGMARVHLGRLVGPVNFSRTVAIKCLHSAHGRDAEFVSMLLDEAHLASRIRHPNVVGMLDVVTEGAEVFLVLEYVHGDSLAELIRQVSARGERIPLPVVSSIVSGMLLGLHAAHEATDPEHGPLGIVHRDVSPHNVLVGTDGIARVLDFGIAKAASRLQSTGDGQLKGKLRYMSPEQLGAREVDRRADVFAASAVLWEALVGKRLFDGPDPGAIVGRILNEAIAAPSSMVDAIPESVDAVCMRGLARAPDDRFATAREMAIAVERAVAPASPREVGEWVERVAGGPLRTRAAMVARAEGGKHAPVSGARSGKAAAISDDATAPHERGAATTDVPPASAPAQTGPSQDTEAAQTLPRVPATRVTGSSSRPLHAALGLLGLGALVAIALFARTPSSDTPRQSPAAELTVVPAPASDQASTAATHASIAAPPPVATQTSATTAASSPSPARVTRPPRPARADCNPPFVMRDGIKQFKPHCL
jgi:serine/threonine-protein kinase